MTSGDDFSILNRSIWPDGTVRWLSGAGRIHLGDHGEPVRGVGISLDVTERRALEEQYQQAQKMEAIGRSGRRRRHDFNNILTVIVGHCELLLADLDRHDVATQTLPYLGSLVASGRLDLQGGRPSQLSEERLATCRHSVLCIQSEPDAAC